jgi:hypothetical protein
MLFDSFIHIGFLLGAVLVPCRNFLLSTFWSVLLLFALLPCHVGRLSHVSFAVCGGPLIRFMFCLVLLTALTSFLTCVSTRVSFRWHVTASSSATPRGVRFGSASFLSRIRGSFLDSSQFLGLNQLPRPQFAAAWRVLDRTTYLDLSLQPRHGGGTRRPGRRATSGGSWSCGDAVGTEGGWRVGSSEGGSSLSLPLSPTLLRCVEAPASFPARLVFLGCIDTILAVAPWSPSLQGMWVTSTAAVLQSSLSQVHVASPFLHYPPLLSLFFPLLTSIHQVADEQGKRMWAR